MSGLNSLFFKDSCACLKRCFPQVLLVVLFCLLASCSSAEESSLEAVLSQEGTRPPVENPPGELIASQSAFIKVSRKVTPAVVNISAVRRAPSARLSPGFDDFFGEFFRERSRRPRRQNSLGSGFIVTKDGYILTNEHVVRGAEEIQVKLSDARVYPATVVGADPRTDVAVIKVEAEDELPTVVLGDSDGIRVGQWALAIGNPFGLDRTLTVGVISATGRANVGIEDYEDFIQTDASINPGNSGGPLLNIYGEVIGINTAIVASGQGIGFAIPVNLARIVTDQLIKDGKVTRGWLGVRIQEMTPELAQSFGLERVRGALVTEVIPATPAADALRQGDIILRFNERDVAGPRELRLMVASSVVGEKVILDILRNGDRTTVEIVLAARESFEDSRKSGDSVKMGGLTVESNPDGPGVVVTGVDTDGSAYRGGVRAGDLILAVESRKVVDLEDFSRAMKEAEGRKALRLLIRRGEATLYLAFPMS